MPTTIKLKNSVTTTAAPTTLVQGEAAVNVTDKKVWVGNAASSPVQILGAGATIAGTTADFSGVATFSAGSVSAPAITTTGDTNTGMYFPAADTIAFTEGGVESMRIDASGQVGIGTSSPSSKLDVVSSSDLKIRIKTTTGSNTAGIDIMGNNATVDSNNVILYQGGSSECYLYNRANAEIRFGTNNTERMRITSAGNVGIGDSSPAYKLTVNGTVYAYSSSSSATFLSQNTGGAWFANAQGSDYAITESGVGEWLRVKATTGNVGIGTSSPYSKLHVVGSGFFTGRTVPSSGAGVEIYGDGSNYGAFLAYNRSTSAYIRQEYDALSHIFSGSGTERMRIDSSGNLLVGTTTIASQGKMTLDFNGSSNQGINIKETANQSSAGFMYFQYSTTVLGTITRATSTNAVLYNTTSDIRLKENITEAKPALDTVSNIKVRQYDWIGCENSHQDYGFIAQELAEVVSDVVTKGRTEEDTWAVDYGKLTPILCKAIQEQQALIENLTTRLNALEGK